MCTRFGLGLVNAGSTVSFSESIKASFINVGFIHFGFRSERGFGLGLRKSGSTFCFSESLKVIESL